MAKKFELWQIIEHTQQFKFRDVLYEVIKDSDRCGWVMTKNVSTGENELMYPFEMVEPVGADMKDVINPRYLR